MKFCLISAILLLVPLASADLGPNVLIKVLHKDNYFIGEGVDSRGIEYKYIDTYLDKRPTESLDILLYNSTQEAADSMSIRGNSQRSLEKLEIAVEMFEEESMKGVSCIEKSEERLRDKIITCTGPMAVRSLTNEERLQIQNYKLAQKKSGEAFRVRFERTNMKMESFGQMVFKTFRSSELSYDPRRIVYVGGNIGRGVGRRLMFLKKTMVHTPLVIVGHPEGSGVDCKQLESTDMTLEHCLGEVTARREN